MGQACVTLIFKFYLSPLLQTRHARSLVSCWRQQRGQTLAPNPGGVSHAGSRDVVEVAPATIAAVPPPVPPSTLLQTLQTIPWWSVKCRTYTALASACGRKVCMGAAQLAVHEGGESVAVEGDATSPHLCCECQRRTQPLPSATLPIVHEARSVSRICMRGLRSKS